jgi:hypothetical protein
VKPGPAELLLRNLGVTGPKDIDLEAIAWTLGVRVKYRPLDGCEACIAGDAERAIITVNSRSPRRRRRYSIGHELGHWKHHRGQVLVCRAEEIGRGGKKDAPAERAADTYAADLLMPGYLFRPFARAHPKLNFKTVRALADAFDTSLTSTAIRLVEAGHAPALLVCHGPNGKKWFTAGPDVPARWWPQEMLDHESSSFGVLFGGLPDDAAPRKIGADAWFDRDEAARYDVEEQTIRTGDAEVITLILIQDEEMLEERDFPTGWRRR